MEEVQKLNLENSEKTYLPLTTEHLDVEAGAPPEEEQPKVTVCCLADSLCEDSRVGENLKIIDQVEVKDIQTELKPEKNEDDVVKESEDASKTAVEKKQAIPTLEDEVAPELSVAPENDKDLTTTR